MQCKLFAIFSQFIITTTWISFFNLFFVSKPLVLTYHPLIVSYTLRATFTILEIKPICDSSHSQIPTSSTSRRWKIITRPRQQPSRPHLPCPKPEGSLKRPYLWTLKTFNNRSDSLSTCSVLHLTSDHLLTKIITELGLLLQFSD